MKIYLLDVNKSVTNCWSKYFVNLQDENEVQIVNQDFATFLKSHPEIDAVVSPANAFGLMDGGYDKVITNYFGKGLMEKVQKAILEDWFGEQPVGTSIVVPIDKDTILIHTPSMRVPEPIVDSRIVYQCMRTSLISAIHHNVTNVVIPAFGGMYGGVDYDVIAKMMFLAYQQVFNPPTSLNWRYANHNKLKIEKNRSINPLFRYFSILIQKLLY